MKVTQSMCRITVAEGLDEKSNCVACKSDCIDIDAEKTYWKTLMHPVKQRQYYGYAGIVAAYFSYYYVYAGNWWYYLSGVWSHEPDQLSNLLHSGVYLAAHPLGIPKLVAVPLFLGFGALSGYGLGVGVERLLLSAVKRRLPHVNRVELAERMRHVCFSLTTFMTFNLFFLFGGHNFLYMLPKPLPNLVQIFLGATSGMWLYRTLKRTPQAYSQEAMGKKFQGQRLAA